MKNELEWIRKEAVMVYFELTMKTFAWKCCEKQSTSVRITNLKPLHIITFFGQLNNHQPSGGISASWAQFLGLSLFVHKYMENNNMKI
jgi:hypothetical protein